MKKLKQLLKEALPPRGGTPLGGAQSKRNVDVPGMPHFDDVQAATSNIEELVRRLHRIKTILDSGQINAINGKLNDDAIEQQLNAAEYLMNQLKKQLL